MEYLKTFENYNLSKTDDNIKLYFSGDLKREFLLILIDDDIVKGGILCGRPNTGEKDFFTVTKSAVSEFRKGYGTKLYQTAISLMGDRGLSPHRKTNSTRDTAKGLWKSLDGKSYIKRIDLDLKLYDNKPLLDSKYIIIDDSLRKKLLNNVKKIGDDAFDNSIDVNKKAWDIINKEMNIEN
jgi:hypothetical protein